MHYAGTYAYNHNATTSIEHEELYPITERFLDHLTIPAPNRAYKFLRDQYPFFRHGLLINAYNTPILLLFK
jgi:hypothetical protein